MTRTIKGQLSADSTGSKWGASGEGEENKNDDEESQPYLATKFT